MIDLKISLDSIPYEKQRVLTDHLEELNGVKVLSAVFTRDINTTHVTFEKGGNDPDQQAKMIINVLRKYKVYKQQMPTWKSSKWSYDLLENDTQYLLMLARKE